jgi:hypothetical protein
VFWLGIFERASYDVVKPPSGTSETWGDRLKRNPARQHTAPGFFSILPRIGERAAMSVRSDAFVRRWVADNVMIEPGVSDPTNEAARLTGEILIDAAKRGITESELKETMGEDVVGYMLEAYDLSHDPPAFD